MGEDRSGSHVYHAKHGAYVIDSGEYGHKVHYGASSKVKMHAGGHTADSPWRWPLLGFRSRLSGDYPTEKTAVSAMRSHHDKKGS